MHRQEVSPLRLARGARTAGNLLPPTAGPSVFLSSTTAVHRPTPPLHVPPWGGRTAVVEVDARLPRKGNSNSHGVSPVRETTSVITWSRTSRLPIKNSLSLSLEKLHPRIPDATSSLDPAPFALHPTPFTLHPTPFTLHPTPFTLHPTPYTLHPTPYTLHPLPYTLHPSPFTLRPGP